MIEVKHLTKRYGSHLAVDDLSFTVEKGRIYGLLGPNGAGKSTTMNIITGYLSPTSGTVTVDGHDTLEQADAARRCIGYLPEQPPLYLDMTVREYLRFVAELKKVKKPARADQVERVVQRAGLTPVSDRLIRNLSKGYRQRVGVAQALLGEPKVIILDEPTVGLDPAQVIELRRLIRDLGKEHTVILSSHILSEVQAICDEVLIIADGKLVASDSPDRLSSRAGAGGALKVTALGAWDAIRKALLALQNVADVTRDGETNGELSFTVQCRTGADMRAAVSRALSGAGATVLGMTAQTMSLEDTYLQLTGAEENADAEAVQTAAADADEAAENPSGPKAETDTADENTDAGKEE